MFQLRNLFVTKPAAKPEFNSIYTKDWGSLQDAPGWLFFEYGEFKRSLPSHIHFEQMDLKPRSYAFTQGSCPLWNWNDNQQAFPIAMNLEQPDEPPVKRARIGGEIYLVPTEKIPQLDAYRQNGIQFERKSVNLILPSMSLSRKGGVFPTQVRAFAYLGLRSYWKPQIKWANDFFKGREQASFSIIEPRDVRNRHPWLGWYRTFEKQHTADSNTRCFIGLTNGRFANDPRNLDKQAA